MDRLGPLAHPDTPEEGALLASLGPPTDPSGYRFSYPPDIHPTPEQLRLDSELRASMHALGFPQEIAAPVHAGLAALSARLESAARSDIDAHLKRFGAELRSAWGVEFDSRIEAVDTLLEALPGAAGERIRSKPWLTADRSLMEGLLSMAFLREARRA